MYPQAKLQLRIMSIYKSTSISYFNCLLQPDHLKLHLQLHQIYIDLHRHTELSDH